jgi:predicted transcriptional regulator
MAKSSFGELGRRERQIMDILARRGRATAAEVLEDLPDPPSYSSVRGMLRLLEEKGYARHEWDGPRYVYIATANQEQLQKSALSHLVQTFFGNSTEAAVVAMLGSSDAKLTREELDRIAKLIEEARQSPASKDGGDS